MNSCIFQAASLEVFARIKGMLRGKMLRRFKEAPE